MDSFSDDVLTDILIRVLLHCREAARCATVCKRWSSLISTTDFARSFTDRRRILDGTDFSSTTLLLLIPRSHSFVTKEFMIIRSNNDNHANCTDESLSFLPWDDVVIRAYHDDLLLVSQTDYKCVVVGYSFCICNPLTKKYWCGVPEPFREILKIREYVLTCHKGGDNLSYDVTLVFHTCQINTLWVTKFSSEIGMWSWPTPIHMPSASCMGFFTVFGSLIHKPVFCGDDLVYFLQGNDRSEWVVALDLKGQRESRIILLPIPDDNNSNIGYVRLGCYRGRLRAAHVTHDIVLRVWERSSRDDGASRGWYLLHNKTPPEMGLDLEYGQAFPISFHPDDGNVVFLSIDNGDVWQYDISCERGKIVRRFSYPRVWRMDNLEFPSFWTVYPLLSTSW